MDNVVGVIGDLLFDQSVGKCLVRHKRPCESCGTFNHHSTSGVQRAGNKRHIPSSFPLTWCRGDGMAYWWVNHKQTRDHEVRGGYLWSPYRNTNGAFNQTYENMKLVRPGDIVFSYAHGRIGTVGRVTEAASPSPKPIEFGVAYGTAPIDLAEGRWQFMNTLFSLSEACLYMQLVDLLDLGRLEPGLSYLALRGGPERARRDPPRGRAQGRDPEQPEPIRN